MQSEEEEAILVQSEAEENILQTSNIKNNFPKIASKLSKLGKEKNKVVEKSNLKDSNTKSESGETEQTKLAAKMIKVDTYWKKTSYFIPNVFRLVKKIPNDLEHVFEF